MTETECSMRLPTVVLAGLYQMGKSTCVNCLLDAPVARIGGGNLTTTHLSTRYVWGDFVDLTARDDLGAVRHISAEDAKGLSRETFLEMSLWRPLLKDINLLDTPGLQADEKDTVQALAALDAADFVILIVNNQQLSMPELAVLEEVQARRLPFIMLMNCTKSRGANYWRPDSKANDEIVRAIQAQLDELGASPIPLNGEKIPRCNLYWYWWASGLAAQQLDSAGLSEAVGDLESYFRRTKVPDMHDLAQQSCFLPVRQFFQSHPWGQYGAGGGAALAKIRRSIRTWEADVHDLTHQLISSLE